MINVLGHGVMTQPGVTEKKRQAAVASTGGFMIEQQRQPFGMTKPGGLVVGGKIGKSLRHAGQAELPQLIKGWMFEQSNDRLQTGPAHWRRSRATRP